jgi:hypothetical protein
MAADQIVQIIYSYLLGWTSVMLVICLIAKIIQSIGPFTLRVGGSALDKVKDIVSTRAGKAPRPNPVTDFEGKHNGTSVSLWWKANAQDENITRYEIQREGHKSGKFWRAVQRPTRAYDKAAPLTDNGATISKLKLNETIQPNLTYHYRIRAVNASGDGAWTYHVVHPAPGAAPTPTGTTTPPAGSSPANTTAQITNPPKDAPHLSAVRAIGNNAPMTVEGAVNGPPGTHYDLLFGIYDANTNNLVAKLIEPPLQYIASGEKRTRDIDFSKVDLASGEKSQLPAGKYNIILFAHIYTGRPQVLPANTSSIPPGWIKSDPRKIEITSGSIGGSQSAKPEAAKNAKVPVLTLEPDTKIIDHKKPLQPEFGGMVYTLHSGDNEELQFDISRSNMPKTAMGKYHVFIVGPKGNQLTDVDLKELYGVTATLKLGPRNKQVSASNTKHITGQPDFYMDGVISDKANITISLTRDPARTLQTPVGLAVFVAVQDKIFSRGTQFKLNNEMFELAIYGQNNSASLASAGVLDFNYLGIILVS